MTLRAYLNRLESQGGLVHIQAPISKRLELASVLKKLEPQPVRFDRVRESAIPVIGNLFCNKAIFANYFGISASEIIPLLTRAFQDRASCPQWSGPPALGAHPEGLSREGSLAAAPPCQEVIDLHPDLDDLPIPFHYPGEGGNYISAGVVIARHPVHGLNVDFHRCMQISKTEMAMRVVKGRHFDTFLSKQKELDVAICVGNSPNLLAAAATSVELGVNELEIANALELLPVAKAVTVDLQVPAEAEFVLEGTVYLERRHAEGPFVDLTDTYDIVRQEPVFVLKAITHRTDPFWQALLPGGLEHKLLMGMPREPTIFHKVNEVVRCLDVNVGPGGCSWLHAIIQIDKQHEDDGRKAIEAAFAGHRSCKHVFVVDQDVDIYNPLEVEWALATRFQGDVDLVVKARERGSSLDPSAEPGTSLTTKLGFDLTKPLTAQGKGFERAVIAPADPGVGSWTGAGPDRLLASRGG
jgi:UbiD family decarboxylase